MLVIFLLEAGGYGRPRLLPLRGQTHLAAVPEITIEWDRMTLASSGLARIDAVLVGGGVLPRTVADWHGVFSTLAGTKRAPGVFAAGALVSDEGIRGGL
jgi:hypothetical protein